MTGQWAGLDGEETLHGDTGRTRLATREPKARDSHHQRKSRVCARNGHQEMRATVCVHSRSSRWLLPPPQTPLWTTEEW